MTAKRKLFHSYTFRLALLYAIIFSGSTLILFNFFYLFTASYMTQQMDNTIEAEIQGLAERYNEEGLEGLSKLIADRVARQQGRGNSIYLLTNYILEPIVGNIDRWPKNATVDNEWLEFFLEVSDGADETHLARARVFQLPGRFGLLVGRDIHQLTQAKRSIVQAVAWGLVIMLLLAFAGGLVLSRRTVRKIERINQTARRIVSGDLTRRIPVTNRNDDFDQLAQNLNNMLDQIQTLMDDIRRVSDNIAHDLRTPLARLRQGLEEARQTEGLDSRSIINLENSIREADSLLSTFNALLRIARVEAKQINADFEDTDFHKLLEDVVEFYEPLAEDKSQTLSLSANLKQGVVARGDRDLLFQALANLIENAIKYTPENGQIQATLDQKGEDVVIVIADNGPGIPGNEGEKVFRRFYRLDRSRSTAGNGLGLSMVSAVISMHNGTITLLDNRPGLKVVIRIPKTENQQKKSSTE